LESEAFTVHYASCGQPICIFAWFYQPFCIKHGITRFVLLIIDGIASVDIVSCKFVLFCRFSNFTELLSICSPTMNVHVESCRWMVEMAASSHQIQRPWGHHGRSLLLRHWSLFCSWWYFLQHSEVKVSESTFIDVTRMLKLWYGFRFRLIRRSPINLARIAFNDAVVFLYYTAKKHNFMILGKRIADFPVISVQYG